MTTDDAVYEAFGGTIAETGSTPTPYGFQAQVGYRRDEETGRHEARRRMYDEMIGRFLSQDPKGFEAGDSNFYRYVGNNPANYSDPGGEERLLVPQDLLDAFPADSRTRYRRELQRQYDTLPLRTIAELTDTVGQFALLSDAARKDKDTARRKANLDYYRQWITRAAGLIEERQGDDQNAPLAAKQRLWRIQGEIQPLRDQFFGVKKRLDELQKSILPVPRSAIISLQKELARLRKALHKRHRIIGTTFREGSEVSQWPFTRKFAKAVDYAVKSDKLSLPIKEKLLELVEPESLATLGAFFATTVAVRVWAPEAAAVLDVAFAAFGGAPTVIAAYEIFSAVNNAADEPDLRTAGNTIVDIMSGALAESVINLLTWGAGRTAGRYAKRKADAEGRDISPKALAEEETGALGKGNREEAARQQKEKTGSQQAADEAPQPDVEAPRTGAAGAHRFKPGVTLGPEDEVLINSLRNRMNKKGWKGDPVIVRFLDDGTMEILDGHHRVAAAARSRKVTEIPWREATPEELEFFLKHRQQF